MASLKRPDIWEWVEAYCEKIGHGRLLLGVDVHGGIAKQVDVEKVRESSRGMESNPKKRGQEIL